MRARTPLHDPHALHVFEPHTTRPNRSPPHVHARVCANFHAQDKAKVAAERDKRSVAALRDSLSALESEVQARDARGAALSAAAADGLGALAQLLDSCRGQLPPLFEAAAASATGKSATAVAQLEATFVGAVRARRADGPAGAVSNAVGEGRQAADSGTDVRGGGGGSGGAAERSEMLEVLAELRSELHAARADAAAATAAAVGGGQPAAPTAPHARQPGDCGGGDAWRGAGIGGADELLRLRTQLAQLEAAHAAAERAAADARALAADAERRTAALQAAVDTQRCDARAALALLLSRGGRGGAGRGAVAQAGLMQMQLPRTADPLRVAALAAPGPAAPGSAAAFGASGAHLGAAWPVPGGLLWPGAAAESPPAPPCGPLAAAPQPASSRSDAGVSTAEPAPAA
eukprot:66262-Chlamydomonas_euryale.AAC.7